VLTVTTSAAAQPQLRILSYNIHKGIGGRDRRYRLQRIIDVIAHEAPDIICLQEVDCHVKRTRFDNQAQLLSEALGLPYQHFQLNHRIAAGGYGNLIACRLPLLDARSISLTLRGRKVRGAIAPA
jgi:endonuclease/exonuclease/phosphatase family metal-dependent hydrolase